MELVTINQINLYINMLLLLLLFIFVFSYIHIFLLLVFFIYIGTNSQFSSPWGLVVDNYNTYLYITDYNNNILKQYEFNTSIVSTIMGNIQGIAGVQDGFGTNVRIFAYD